MAFTTNSITNFAKAGSSSVSCNVIKIEDSGEEAMVAGDKVSLQTISTGADVAIAGTTTSTGTALAGTTTAYLTELPVGSVIGDGSGEFREVLSVADDTNAVLVTAFTVDLSSDTVTIKTGATVRTVQRLLDHIGIMHFTRNLKKDLDPTDTVITKLS